MLSMRNKLQIEGKESVCYDSLGRLYSDHQ